jgi:hypothetical protein
MAESESESVPHFLVRQSREGVWFVIADWPDDGEEVVQACVSEEEGRQWIRTKAQGWLQGRKAPYA